MDSEQIIETNQNVEAVAKKSKKTKKSTEKKVEQTAQNVSDDTPVVQEVQKPVDQPVVQAVEQSAEQSVEQSAEQSAEQEDDEKVSTSSPDEYLKNIHTIVELLTEVSSKNIKDFDISKDFLNTLSSDSKKINKLNLALVTSLQDFLLKENITSLKKVSKSSKAPKKVVNKENFAINKVNESYPEVLKFMGVEQDTPISKGQIIQKVNAFVKEHKTANNPDIFVEGDNRSFRLIGDLKVLFTFIEKQMIERGDMTKGDKFPEHIAYTGIMKYLKYCFPPVSK
jgi:hypothetical protein